MRMAERFEDMSPCGRLQVLQQGDGDMIVTVIEDVDSKGCCAGLAASVEFCTSGGKSPKTREALRALMLAMAEENAADQHCSRRGERGLGVDEAVPSASLYADLWTLLAARSPVWIGGSQKPIYEVFCAMLRSVQTALCQPLVPGPKDQSLFLSLFPAEAVWTPPLHVEWKPGVLA